MNFFEFLLKNKGCINPQIFRQELLEAAKSPKEIYGIEKLAPYLYTINYNNIEYEFALDYLEKKYTPFGGCSAFRKGNYCARNYDWYYDDSASFMIKVEANEDRYASIGMAGGIEGLNPTFVDSNQNSDLYRILPMLTLDGINSQGVACNINILTPDKDGDHGHYIRTTGTNPVSEISMSALCLVRMILDFADSAVNGLDLINQFNIWTTMSENLDAEYHYCICDAEDTIVVEFIDNKVCAVCISDRDIEDFSAKTGIPEENLIILPKETFEEDDAIMALTNFYLINKKDGQLELFDGNPATNFFMSESYDKDLTTLNYYPMGIERFRMILKNAENFTSIEKGFEILELIKYSNTYQKDGVESYYKWYSEFVGNLFNIDSTAEEIEPYYSAYADFYSSDLHQRGDGTWFTSHSSVYDLANKTLTVAVQEDFENKYEFSIE